jgi:hypothetical protein
MNKEYVERAVRRRVGLEALRRLRRLVDADRESEADNARWSRRLLPVFVMLAGLAVLSIWLAS